MLFYSDKAQLQDYVWLRKGYNLGHDDWVWNQVRLEMTSRLFCAHGNTAIVIGNKGRAPIVCALLDRKLGWASEFAC